MTLMPGTTYYYRVKAINNDQESDYSQTIAVTTLTDNNSLKTVVPANPPNIFRVNTFSNRAEVYLDNPSSNEGIEEYKVTLSTNSDFSNPLYNNLTYIVDKNTNYAIVNQVKYLVFSLNNLNSNTIYYLRIRSVNKIGQSTNIDTSFTTKTVLQNPIALGVTNLTAIAARVNWTKVNAATSYVLDLSTNPNFSSFIISNLDVGDVIQHDIGSVVGTLVENTTYYYRVRAKQGSTLSSYSNTISFTTLDDIQNYDGLSFNINNPIIIGAKNNYLTSFELLWYPVQNAVNYTLDISNVPDFSTFITQNINTTESKYNFIDLLPGNVYYIRVKANSLAKSSGYTIFSTNTLVANTNLSPPQALTPSNVLSTGFIFNWVKRNYASRYMIQISTTNNFSNIVQTLFVGNIDSFIIDNLTPNTTYYLKLYGLSSTESSNSSNIVSIQTAITLPSISLLDASEITDSSVRLAWTMNNIYTKYRVSIYKTIDFDSITEGRTNFLGNGFFNNLDIGNISNYVIDLFLEPSCVYSYYITGETTNGDYKKSEIGTFTTKAKAPVIQISTNGKHLEWSGALTKLEVSTDKDFKSLLQGWHPRTVENIGSFDISNLTTMDTCVYIRGYDVVNGVKGNYSNTLSTFNKTPILLPPTITKTTALLKWKKNNSDNYSIQIFVDNGGNNYIPLSGFIFPVNIGDVDYFYIKDLTADTKYSVYLSWFDIDRNKFESSALPLYFKTNNYDTVSELTTNGVAPTITTSKTFDRITVSMSTEALYLIEISKRADFLALEKYLETNSLNTSIVLEPDTTYYLKIYKKDSSNKTEPYTATITTDVLPSYGASITSAPVLSSPSIINENEIVLTWTGVLNANAYTVELSDSNTFNLIDKVYTVTTLDTTKALVSGLLGSKTYFARVYAYNAHSISNYSNTVTIDTTP